MTTVTKRGGTGGQLYWKGKEKMTAFQEIRLEMKVTQISVDSEGVTTGSYDDNPFLNSIIYDIDFSDGTVKEYSANVIAENMLTQVDSDGYDVMVFNTTVIKITVFQQLKYNCKYHR